MKKNILLVEDDPALRMVMREVLKDEFDIEEADNGADGIDKGLRAPRDLIILDYHLPKKDGLQVIEAIKAANPDVPVIVLTGYLNPESEARFSQLGASKIFPKPFNYRMLLETVRTLLVGEAVMGEVAPEPSPAPSLAPLSATERDALASSLETIAALAEKVEFLQSVTEKYWIEPDDIAALRETARCMEIQIQAYYGNLNSSLLQSGSFHGPLLEGARRPCVSGVN